MGFQMMFAIITPALISGAFAERMKFSRTCVFIVLWSHAGLRPALPLGLGPGGWLRQRGALDFAGGTVVHLSLGHRGARVRDRARQAQAPEAEDPRRTTSR
jgi:Amt family ammonium transporter